MEIVEKELVEAILATKDLSPSKLGLRFDRVVVTVLARLRNFTDALAPNDTTILVTITAPILLPAKTAEDLQQCIGSLLSSHSVGGDRIATVRGNDVRVRLVTNAPQSAPRLIGFVHNRQTTAEALLDLAEQWLLNSVRVQQSSLEPEPALPT